METNMRKTPKNILRTIFISLFALTCAFLPSITSAASPVPNPADKTSTISEQRRNIERNPMYDRTAEVAGCDDSTAASTGSTTSTGPITGGGLFMIGDSIGVGMKAAGLETDLSNKGFTANLQVEGSRRINYPGTTGPRKSGFDIANENTDAIKGAKVVVIELGTNNEENFAGNLQRLVDIIKTANSSVTIFLIDVAVRLDREDDIKGREKNVAIYAQATKLGTTVISRYKIHFPSGDPVAYSGAETPSVAFTSDGIHNTTDGAKALNNALITTITSSVAAPDPAPSTTQCCPSGSVGTTPQAYPADTACIGIYYPTVKDEAAFGVAIDEYIKSVNPRSPLIGKGSTFVQAGKRYGVNPMLTVNIGRMETVLGKVGSGLPCSNNPFGIKARRGRPTCGRYAQYPTFEEAIMDQALLIRGYIDNRGAKTIYDVMSIYCPPVFVPGDGTCNTNQYVINMKNWIQLVINRAGAAIACNDATPAPVPTTPAPSTSVSPSPTPGSGCTPTADPPGGGGGLVTGERSALNARLLGNPLFTADTVNKNDIQNGIVTDRLVGLMLALVEQGKFPVRVSATKSDHDKCTANGSISIHYRGRAMDIGNVEGPDKANGDAMHKWLYDNRVALDLDELIFNPVPAGSSNLDGGNPHSYGSATMNGHKDHIHVSIKGPDSTSTASSGSRNCR